MKQIKKFFSIIAAMNLCFLNTGFASSYDVTIEDVLSNTKISSNSSVPFAPIWYQVRSQFSASDRAVIDTWTLINPDLKFSGVSSVHTKQANGSKSVRLMVSSKNQLNAVEFIGESNKFALINGKVFSTEEAKTLSKIASKVSESSSELAKIRLSLSPSTLEKSVWKDMTIKQKAEYLVNQRMVLESAQKVLKTETKKTVQHATQSFYIANFILKILSAPAFAQESFKSCLTESGFISEITNGKCDSAKIKNADSLSGLSCSAGQSLCNPYLYGTNRSTGAALCIDSSSSKTCGELSPLTNKADAKELMRSISKILKDRSPDDNISKQISDKISAAVKICEDSSDIQKNGAVCQELIQRKSAFNSYIVDLKSNDSSAQKPEQRADRGSKDRQSKMAQTEEKSNIIESETKKETCSWFCSLTNWITTPTGILTSVLVGLTAVCATQRFALKSGYCAKKQTATASTTTTTIVPGYTAPLTPTTPDYTGVVQ